MEKRNRNDKTNQKEIKVIVSEETQKKKELYDSTKYISVDLINQVAKSVCKIISKINDSDNSGTGFFMNVFNNINPLRYLITNNHLISEKLKDKYIQLEIHNKKIIKLFLSMNVRISNFLKIL